MQTQNIYSVRRKPTIKSLLLWIAIFVIATGYICAIGMPWYLAALVMGLSCGLVGYFSFRQKFTFTFHETNLQIEGGSGNLEPKEVQIPYADPPNYAWTSKGTRFFGSRFEMLALAFLFRENRLVFYGNKKYFSFVAETRDELETSEMAEVFKHIEAYVRSHFEKQAELKLMSYTWRDGYEVFTLKQNSDKTWTVASAFQTWGPGSLEIISTSEKFPVGIKIGGEMVGNNFQPGFATRFLRQIVK